MIGFADISDEFFEWRNERHHCVFGKELIDPVAGCRQGRSWMGRFG